MDRSDRLSLSSQAPLCNEDRQITWRDVKVDGIFSFFLGSVQVSYKHDRGGGG